MANFFAQPDALANGKSTEQVLAEGIPKDMAMHRTFHGNRPSLSLLFPQLTAYATGQLLSLYEHRTAVQGFIWDINSFDQWGVELGKKLANDVKDLLIKARIDPDGGPVQASSPSTTRMLNYYVNNSRHATCDHICNTNPITTITRKTHRDYPPPSNDLKGKSGKLS